MLQAILKFVFEKRIIYLLRRKMMILNCSNTGLEIRKLT
jgi:hypothetical protein